VLVIGGGALLVGSAFMYWVSRGYGSGLRGHALIDAVVAAGRNFPGLSAARLTVLWYFVPAFGAASWIAVGLRGAGGRATRIVAVCAALAALLSVLAIIRLVGFDHLGRGAWAAVIGAFALVIGSWAVATG
jgi:hypothetical protein